MLVALSVGCYLSYDGSVGNASAYQSVDSWFEYRLRLICFDKVENIPLFRGRLVQYGILPSGLGQGDHLDRFNASHLETLFRLFFFQNGFPNYFP